MADLIANFEEWSLTDLETEQHKFMQRIILMEEIPEEDMLYYEAIINELNRRYGEIKQN